MRHGIRLAVVLIATFGLINDAFANLTNARATPRQAQITGSSDNVIRITWRVSTTSDHTSGVSSPIALIVDAATGQVLSTVNTTFDAGGPGPFTFRETLQIDAATARTWVARGVTQLLFTRSFTEATGNLVEGRVALRLSGSRLQATRDDAPAALAINALRLEFDSGNNTAITSLDETLRAQLTVQYSGTGMLRGRWQIAGPESPDGAPVYRTIALVNRNLATSQRSTLHSPQLPADRSGRYLVRFCVLEQDVNDIDADAQCPNARLTATAVYQVQGPDSRALSEIRGLMPQRAAVDANTVFSWDSLTRAHIYQLQVFALAPAEAGLPASRSETDSVEPTFVTGMLLDSATSQTALSDLVRSKLERGRRYLWRVTAHDETGRMIGRSAEASFLYAPAE